MYGAAEFLGLMGNSGPSFGFVHSMAKKKKKQAELTVCLPEHKMETALKGVS